MPLFADPIDWDKTKTYEPLTIVYHQGNSYTSRQSVPAGVDITTRPTGRSPATTTHRSNSTARKPLRNWTPSRPMAHSTAPAPKPIHSMSG